MEANVEKLYSELRTMRKELKESLNSGKCSSVTKPIIEEELKDIEETIKRIEQGSFGFCEMSGELIPFDYLSMVPTIKTIEDIDQISKFYCKPIHS